MDRVIWLAVKGSDDCSCNGRSLRERGGGGGGDRKWCPSHQVASSRAARQRRDPISALQGAAHSAHHTVHGK